MPVALLRRTAIIVLTLCLAACVSASAEQEPRFARSAGGIQQEAARPLVIHPTTFVCVPQSRQHRRPIPPGKRIEDLCPPGASALLFHDPLPSVSHMPLYSPAALVEVLRSKTYACMRYPQQQRRPIPPGKKIEDLCPPGTRALLFYDPVPSGSLPSPFGLHTANPHEPQPDPGGKSP